MIITKLQVENFLPFGGCQTIDLAPDGGRPLVVVFAPNGRGKSSILNAIRWGLYGRAYRHTAKEIGLYDLANKEAYEREEYEFGVTLEFSVGSDEYRLVRRASPRRLVSQPRRDADYQVHLSMAKNGFQLPQDQVLHEINQVAPEQISRFFLFDGELLDQYEALLVEGSDQGRIIREAIERVLGVPALVRAREDLRLLERAAIRDHSRDESQMQGLADQQARLEDLLNDADKLDEQSSVLGAQIDQFQQDLEILESQLEGAERALKNQADLNAAKRASEEAEQRLATVESEAGEARAQVWEDLLFKAMKPFEEHLAEEAKVLMAASSQRESISREVLRLSKHLDDGVCATCGQALQIAAQRNVQDQLAELDREASRILTDPVRLRKVMGQQQHLSQIRANGALRILTALESQRNTLTLRHIELEAEIERLQEELEGQDTESMKTMRTRARAIEAEKGDLEREKAAADAESELKQRQAVALRKAMEVGTTSERHALSRIRRETIAKLLAIAEATIEELRSRLRLEVQAHATEAFKRMTNQPLYDRLEINESYGLKIVDNRSREVPLRSAGNEQVVALALIGGLHKTGMGSGGMVMDTPFGRLDPDHRTNIIQHLATSSPQVVMLVHEGEVSKDFVIQHLADFVTRAFELKDKGVFLTEVRAASLGVAL